MIENSIAWVRLWWRRLIGRHDDGTKHVWVDDLPLIRPHYCEWDYCHCVRQGCERGCVRDISDGVQEVR